MSMMREYNTPGNRRRIVLILAVIAVVTLLVGTAIALKWGSKSAGQAKSATTTTVPLAGVDGFDPDDPQYKNVPTTKIDAATTSSTTTVPVTEASETIPPPPDDAAEGTVLTAKQLAVTYNQARSGLQPSVYTQASTTAIAVLKARTTGEGKDKFQKYLAGTAGLPSMKSLRVDYSTAMVSEIDPTYVKTLVWWGGERNYGGTIEQGMTAVYLAPKTLEPVAYIDLPGALKDDPDLDTAYSE